MGRGRQGGRGALLLLLLLLGPVLAAGQRSSPEGGRPAQDIAHGDDGGAAGSAAARQEQRHRLLLQCGAGQHRCGARCVSNTSPSTCGSRCAPCPKPRANGAATCSAAGRCGIKCAAGFVRARNSSDCVRHCPAGMESAGASGRCTVCSASFYKDKPGPGTCTRCPAATAALGGSAAEHDNVDDCWPITCPPGQERNLGAGGCRVCSEHHVKDTWGPQPCSRCRPGTITYGAGASAHDEQSDCMAISCPPGQEADAATGACRVCRTNMYRTAGRGSEDYCMPCAPGTRTLGTQQTDHDSPDDCFPGGLVPSNGGRTGATYAELLDFDELLDMSRNNTGGRAVGGKGGTRSRRRGACLYDCIGVANRDLAGSIAVAHLAGAPSAYRSDRTSDVRAGVNVVGRVYDQGPCAVCINSVITSAAESSVALARRIDASTLSFSHAFAYHCLAAYGDSSPARTCSTGWSFQEALSSMRTAATPFLINSSCVGDKDLTRLSFAPMQLASVCNQVKGAACAVLDFTCSAVALSDGWWGIQRHLRRHGAAVTRIRVTSDFKAFFDASPAGVYNGTESEDADPFFFWHAIVLIGYNNEEMFWYAKNSWGPNWADGGMFRIAYGVLDVGFPEETFGLVCDSTSSEPATVAAWSDPWPVVADAADPACVLYKAGPRDTVSGMADHFQTDILDFVEINTRRGVIPTLPLGDPPRQEPQLQGPWEGAVFKVCNIPQGTFDRVATVTCGTEPVGGNATWPGCANTAPGSSCVGTCPKGFNILPTAVCGKDGSWVVTGSCAFVTCDSAPQGGAATWDAGCAGQGVGSTCAGTCRLGFRGSPVAMCASNATWLVAGCWDPCERFPCKPPAQCSQLGNTSVPSGAASVRTCWCAAGENYEDDTLGCMEPLVATPLPVGDEFTYLLFTKPLAWETAELVCRKRNMSLVKLTDSNQSTRLHTEVVRVTGGATRGGPPGYWIGLNDRLWEGSFRWSSDNSLLGRFSGWERYTANGQPDNACDDSWSHWDGVNGCVPGEDCVQAGYEYNGNWNDESCMFPRPFVCSDA